MLPSPSRHPHARYVAMKDSWSHGDDRRDRGRVDRGVTRPRSPTRRPEGDREPKARDHSPVNPRAQHDERPRERSRERRRKHSRSRSPRRDSREAVRERNRGRELLEDTRGSDKAKRSTHHSPSSSKRRKSRSPSPSRSHHKKSRRGVSRSPSRVESGSTSSRPDRKRRSPSPRSARKRSPERKSLESRIGKSRLDREAETSDRRGRSRSPKLGKHEPSRRISSHHESSSKRDRSLPKSSQKPRERSPVERPKERDSRREPSPRQRRRSPDIDRYPPVNRSRQSSPRASRGRDSRGHSPRGTRGDRDDRGDKRDRSDRSDRVEKSSRGDRGERSSRGDRGGRQSRGDFRAGSGQPKGERQTSVSASGANSIEVKSRERRPERPEHPSDQRSEKRADKRPASAASGANNFQVKSEKMNGRGYYGQQGYNPQHQMQAAFPLKPQYDQPLQVDPRQYSQSPQHQMTPGSYHSSPQAQSPYGAGRGNWGPPQYSPQPQYPQNYQQPQQPQQPQQTSYSPPTGPQGNFYNNQASPPYQAPAGPINQQYPQQNFRGNQQGYRGNHFTPRGGRGGNDFRGRGGRGAHFQNLHWSAGGGPPGPGRGQPPYNNSGNVTPQHTSPQQFPSNHASQSGTPQHVPVPTKPVEEDDADDLFRPSKALQVEDKEIDKKKDETQMPPPSKPPPTGPQAQQNSSKFSFAFKGPAKTSPATPKPEISQKLNAVPTRPPVQVSPERPRGPNSRHIPTEPSSARRNDFREPPPPTTRKVKKIMKRVKERPQLADDFKKSDSVYYRKPGNESVVGSGTYGKVFKAVHVYTKNLVALKKIRMEGERDGFPVTAVREIKLLQSLKHHNIVNLQEVMVEKNDCFMVFEYLSHDLTGLLNHPSFKLEPSHKKHLAKQLFEGLDYLHRRGVLHRDIKAANILVSSDGVLKLADFGLARFYAKRRQLDYTNRVITIWYRSPELLLGETQYGPAVDIWSAACVLVEIFTRHAIFPGDGGEISQLEKIYAVLGTPNKVDWPGLVDMAWFELLRPSAKRQNVFKEKYQERVTPAAYELLEAMFQYDPVKRPSASDVLEHPYFTTEEPKPRQAVELATLQGDWHEFESKALRKENERKDKEARRQAQKDAALKQEKEKKRPIDGEAAEGRETKRQQTGEAMDVS